MRGWVVGLLVGGAAAGALVVAALMESSAPAAPPPPLSTLLPGHSYTLVLACPFALPTIPAAGDLAGATAFLGIIPFVTVTSYTPSPDGKTLTFVFDFKGPQMQLPPIQAGGGTACTTVLTDMGASPAGATGGGAPQNVAVQWSAAGAAKAVIGGTLVVTTPGAIASVGSESRGSELEGRVQLGGHRADGQAGQESWSTA